MSTGDEVALNPQPIPPGRLAFARGVAELAAAAILEPDGPSGTTNPHSPGGPVMRDVAAGLAISHAGSLLTDEAERRAASELGMRIISRAASHGG